MGWDHPTAGSATEGDLDAWREGRGDWRERGVDGASNAKKGGKYGCINEDGAVGKWVGDDEDDDTSLCFSCIPMGRIFSGEEGIAAGVERAAKPQLSNKEMNGDGGGGGEACSHVVPQWSDVTPAGGAWLPFSFGPSLFFDAFCSVSIIGEEECMGTDSRIAREGNNCVLRNSTHQ